MNIRKSCATRHKRCKKSTLVFAAPLVAALSIATAASSFSSASAATAATLPDLVVTNIVKPAAAPGTPVTFTATVKNQGTMATPAGTIIGVQFQVDGKNPVTWSDTDKASLAPGASVTLTANGGPAGALWSATTGTHSVRAYVDDVNRMAELNEGNNTLTSTFTVSATAPTPSQLSDLVVSDVAQPAVAAGTPVKFVATVVNQGAGATPAGTIIGVQFQVDGTGPVTWSDTNTTSLAPGASVTLTANAGSTASSWTATSGTHSVRALVDDVNRIGESNETNNAYICPFTVSPAAPPPPTTTPPPPPSGGFKMGVATGWPYGWVTQADVNTMKDLGVGWMRSDVSQGMSLTASDSYINMARAAGLQFIGTFIPTSTNPASSAAWAKTVVAHYAPLGVHVWEWRNESNWMGTLVQPPVYAAEIKAAYVAIHQVDPSAIVLEGGSVTGGTLTVNTYLQQLYANGAGGYFDGVSIHPYCGSNCATATWPEIDQMTTVHNTMAAHGDGAKRVWATEVGASTYAGGYTEATQAQFLSSLVARLHTFVAQGIAAPMFGWYSERDRPSTNVRESHFGLVRPDLSHKPAYATYKALAAAG